MPFVGFHKQMASCLEPDFRNQLGIAGTHFGETALKRAGADAGTARRGWQHCAILSQ